MKRLYILASIILFSLSIAAQEISYKEYMEKVFGNNIALTAKKLDIEIAEASVTNSKVYSDPTLAISYTNNEDWSKELGQGIEFELSKDFTFGVRHGRMDIADKERRQTVALLEEYIRNFRANATIAYLEHIRANMMLLETSKMYDDINAVAINDSIRFHKGDIAESNWLESRMAQGIARNAMLEAEALQKNTAIMLGYFMGDITYAENLHGTGSLEINETPATVEEYIKTAIQNRPDIVVALSQADIAEARLKFNKAQRRPELNVNIGATYNFSNPDFTTLKAGIAIPLKFSSLNKGARMVDETLLKQANIEAEEARLLVETEVMQAYSNFGYATKQAETFSAKMLSDMERVVESKRKAYELGEISFHDYLIVEQNENEMRQQYIDALFGKAAAWVELQHAIGFGLEYKMN